MTVRDETMEVQALDTAIDQMKTSEPERLLHQLTSELSLGRGQVQRTIELLDEGNTIPFIARYRKEMTGELDETQLRTLEERLGYLRAWRNGSARCSGSSTNRAS